MSNASRAEDMRTWITGNPGIGRPGGSYQIRYNKLLNNRRTVNLIPAGVKSWVRSELVLRQDLPKSLARSVHRWKMMMLSVVLSIGFTVNKMIPKYQSGRKHEQRTTWWNERKGRNCEIQQPKQMIFYVAKYEHMTAVLDRLPCRFLRGWAKGPNGGTARAVLVRAALSRGTCQRYRHADGRYFGLGLSETTGCRLATDNKKGARYRPFVSRPLTEPRGENMCFLRGLTPSPQSYPSFTDVKSRC